MEQSDLIALSEALKIIHEANEGQTCDSAASLTTRKSWLWDFDFMELNQWILDISNDEVWNKITCLPLLKEALKIIHESE